jgi:hypothetical protein
MQIGGIIALSTVVLAATTHLNGVGGRIDRRQVSFAVSRGAAGGCAWRHFFFPSDVVGKASSSRTRAIPRKPRHRRLKQVSIDLFVALGRLECGVMEAEVMKPRTTIYLLGGRADHFRREREQKGGPKSR